MTFLNFLNYYFTVVLATCLFLSVVKINSDNVPKCNSTSQFNCGDHCIPLSLVCNGQNDCGGNEDEPKNSCNTNECEESNGGCSQQCVDLPIGYECKCHNGYKLGSNLKACEDVNECEQPGACSQLCSNSKGSYKCDCIDGYMLELNNSRRCRAKEGRVIILLAHRTDIRKIDTQTKECVSVIDSLRSCVALDYDYHMGTMVWSDVADGAIKSVPINTGSPITTLIYENLDTVEGIAVDWIYGHIYWTDTDKDTIEVADKTGKIRKTIVNEDLNEPRAIVLNPFEGWIYFADWGQPARIERVGMDGTHRAIVVSSNIMWPNGLAIDFVLKKIFWADAKLHLLSCVDFDGENRRDIVSSPIILEHPFSIDVFEDWVYWSDWESEGIYKINKFNGEEKSNIATSTSYPMDIHIYHSYKQPKGINYCGSINGGCSHLCLPCPNISEHSIRYTCACPDGMVLTADQMTCMPEVINNITSGSYTVLHYSDFDISSVKGNVSEIFGNKKKLEKPHGVLIGIVIGTLMLFSLSGFLVHKYCLRREIPSLNFNNPVYKKSTEDQFRLERNQHQPTEYLPSLEYLASLERNNLV